MLPIHKRECFICHEKGKPYISIRVFNREHYLLPEEDWLHPCLDCIHKAANFIASLKEGDFKDGNCTKSRTDDNKYSSCRRGPRT